MYISQSDSVVKLIISEEHGKDLPSSPEISNSNNLSNADVSGMKEEHNVDSNEYQTFTTM
jgi:hypothetical protein